MILLAFVGVRQEGIERMGNNGESGSNMTPIPSGGGGSSLDLSTEKDRGLLRTAIKSWPKRWRGLDPDFKDEMLNGLREAGRVARAHLTDPDNSLDAARTVASIVKTAAVIEGQNQADEHLAEKNERLDSGKTTENVGVTPMRVVFDDAG